MTSHSRCEVPRHEAPEIAATAAVAAVTYVGRGSGDGDAVSATAAAARAIQPPGTQFVAPKVVPPHSAVPSPPASASLDMSSAATPPRTQPASMPLSNGLSHGTAPSNLVTQPSAPSGAGAHAAPAPSLMNIEKPGDTTRRDSEVKRDVPERDVKSTTLTKPKPMVESPFPTKNANAEAPTAAKPDVARRSSAPKMATVDRTADAAEESDAAKEYDATHR